MISSDIYVNKEDDRLAQLSKDVSYFVINRFYQPIQYQNRIIKKPEITLAMLEFTPKDEYDPDVLPSKPSGEESEFFRKEILPNLLTKEVR